MIGFRSRYGCQRFAITSLLIMIATIIVLVFFPRWWPILAPFKFGIFSFCGSGYFLATLIICSRHYSDDDDLEFWAAQLMFLIPLICLFTVGITHNIQALSNAAGIFFVLYCIEKYANFRLREPLLIFLQVRGTCTKTQRRFLANDVHRRMRYGLRCLLFEDSHRNHHDHC